MNFQSLILLILLTLCFYSQQIFSQISTLDSIRILAIRVEFQEDNSSTTTGNGKFDLSLPSGQYQIDPPPHNRSYFEDHLLFLGNYFSKISQGRIYAYGDVFPLGGDMAYQLDETMTSYNPNRTPDENNAGLARLFRDAILKADQDADINFSQYHSFVIFHAGVGKDIDLGFDETPQDIPSLFITSEFLQKYLGIAEIPVDNNTYSVSEGIIAPETETQVGIELGLNGILTSNFGSQLGFLDLFSPVTRRSGIGRFGLMDAGLFNGDGLLPALPSAWTRIDAGWEDPVTIFYSAGDEFQISSTLSSRAEKIYQIPINQNEYFLIENRYSGELNLDSLQFELARGRPDYPNTKEVLLRFLSDKVTFSPRGVLIDVENPDIGLPGTGCLIWHIDESIIEMNRSTNQVNADPDHRGVDIEEADGSQDLGQEYDFLSPGFGSEIGYLLDLWYSGNNSPVFKNEFSPASTPNSRSYYARANSHIRIFEFSAPDSQMTFRVNLDIFQRNFPLNLDIQQYGRITHQKVSDLNLNGKQDIVLTTNQGNILVVEESGFSLWGSDSFAVANVGEPINLIPVIFNNPVTLPQKSKGMVVLAESGKVHGFSFTGSNMPDSLFSPFQISSTITTPPVAYYNPDSTVGVVWSSSSGYIYDLIIDFADIQLDSFQVNNTPVQYLHVNSNNQIVSLTQDGNVYIDQTFFKNTELPNSRPVGDVAVGLTGEGKFLLFESNPGPFAEEGLFRFDSPMITNPFIPNSANPNYFVSGNNKLHYFNYNFTIADNFPTKFYHPDRELNLPISPLFNCFFGSLANQRDGVVLTDPSGVLEGFDLQGGRLEDFPLAIGDTIQVTPAILDIDNDGDLDISVISVNGSLNVYDLMSDFQRYGWNQLYYDELNSNRNNNPIDPLIPLPSPNELQLLPEKMVYNWPNPNIDNYTFIRYFLNNEANVSIKIFDMAGDLVDEFTGTGNAGTANELKWNLTGVQSGIYFARVEAQNSQKSEVRIIKIAVIK